MTTAGTKDSDVLCFRLVTTTPITLPGPQHDETKQAGKATVVQCNVSMERVGEWLKILAASPAKIVSLSIQSMASVRAAVEQLITDAPASKQDVLRRLSSQPSFALTVGAHNMCLPLAHVDGKQMTIVHLGSEGKAPDALQTTVDEAFGKSKDQSLVQQVVQVVVKNQSANYGNYGKLHVTRWRKDCKSKQADAFVYCIMNWDNQAKTYRLYVGQAGMLKSRFLPAMGNNHTNSHIRDVMDIVQIVVATRNGSLDPVVAMSRLTSKQLVDLQLADTYMTSNSEATKTPQLPLSSCLVILQAVPDRKQLDDVEELWIQQLDTRNSLRGYNIA